MTVSSVKVGKETRKEDATFGSAPVKEERGLGRVRKYILRCPVKNEKGTRKGKERKGNFENGTRKEVELQYCTWQFPQKGQKLL
jgi:hypothetical protein